MNKAFFSQLRNLAHSVEKNVNELTDSLDSEVDSRSKPSRGDAVLVLRQLQDELTTLKKDIPEVVKEIKDDGGFVDALTLCQTILSKNSTTMDNIEAHLINYGYKPYHRSSTNTSPIEIIDPNSQKENKPPESQNETKPHADAKLPTMEDFGFTRESIERIEKLVTGMTKKEEKLAREAEAFTLPSVKISEEDNGFDSDEEDLPEQFQNPGIIVTPGMMSGKKMWTPQERRTPQERSMDALPLQSRSAYRINGTPPNLDWEDSSVDPVKTPEQVVASSSSTSRIMQEIVSQKISAASLSSCRGNSPLYDSPQSPILTSKIPCMGLPKSASQPNSPVMPDGFRNRTPMEISARHSSSYDPGSPKTPDLGQEEKELEEPKSPELTYSAQDLAQMSKDAAAILFEKAPNADGDIKHDEEESTATEHDETERGDSPHLYEPGLIRPLSYQDYADQPGYLTRQMSLQFINKNIKILNEIVKKRMDDGKPGEIYVEDVNEHLGVKSKIMLLIMRKLGRVQLSKSSSNQVAYIVQ